MDTAQWALVVSTASFVVSGLTFWRNRWAKPSMEIAWDFGGDPAIDLVTDSLRCVARNRGRGDALDVRLEALRADGSVWAYTVGRADKVTFGEEVELWFNFNHSGGFGSDEVGLVNLFGGSRTIDGVPQEGASRTVRVRLTWHEAPRTKKPRVKIDTHTDRSR